MIRMIFFDYDGVLTTDKSGSQTTYRYLSEASGIAQPAISAAFSPYMGALMTGQSIHADVWSQACEAMGVALDIGLLAGAFESTPLNEGMLSLARELMGVYRLGIITDNSRDRMSHLRKYQQLDVLFDPIVVSAEVGSSKRTSEIFRSAAARAGMFAHECVFIDNGVDNVVMARSVGMPAIHHDDHTNDMEALRRALALQGVPCRSG